jgi:hypothetical protein
MRVRVKGGKKAVVDAIYWQHRKGFDAWISIDIIQQNLVSIDVGNCTTRNRYDCVIPHCMYLTKKEINSWINNIMEEL